MLAHPFPRIHFAGHKRNVHYNETYTDKNNFNKFGKLGMDLGSYKKQYCTK